ncbi:MAG: methyltransferase domain-containing protein [Rhizobiales bacterium]|nr:methyltransferase domain-containing protein [Hyphomicrobiales bacterium]
MSISSVKEYYGKTLTGSADLKTNACCDINDMPLHIRSALGAIHPEVLDRYYGCGLVVPHAIEGARVLDLGCGSGRDAYVLSRLVGEKGSVVGVDMTAEQLEVARRHVDFHTEAYGYAKPNISFLEGYIEDLGALGLAPGSFDVIVSNCVINLSPDKPAVLKGAYDLLKPGGELYFADVYADRRLPGHAREDPVLLGECLGGALYWNDFLSLAKGAGFADPRLMSDRPIEIGEPAIRSALGTAQFFSATYRLFKLDMLEPACEDYGQAVIYKGGIEHAEDVFHLDSHHAIEKGRVFPVCGNTWHMLKATRFAPHFTFIGDFSQHYGIFKGCGTNIPFSEAGPATDGAPCC